MELVKKFIAELSPEKREMLINTFNNNMDRIRYIYSSCYISYFYQTSPEGVNTKLEVDNCIRESRKRKLNNIILEKNAANTMKSGQEPSEERKPRKMSEETLLKLRPMEQRIINSQNDLNQNDHLLIWKE